MERNWTCPGCQTNYDGKPEIVTEDPFRCYCSQECYERSVDTDSEHEPRTDGGLPSDSRPPCERSPQWSRAGGEGLPIPHDVDADQFWLFTCCNCGRRWVDPPGPPHRCSCESTEIVCHRFDPETYWNIKRYGDPEPPVTDGGRELVGPNDEPATPEFECAWCGVAYYGSGAAEQCCRDIAVDGGELTCCPECDDSAIRVVGAGSVQRTESTRRYRCHECGARFDEPATRQPEVPNGDTRWGLSKRLADADPDASLEELAREGGGPA